MSATITVEIPAESAYAIASIISQSAVERRTPNGSISRSGNGEFTWKESFRDQLNATASAITKAAEAARVSA